MATKEPEMPACVYVKWDESDGKPFLIAEAEAADLLENEPRKIGVYRLEKVRQGRLAPRWDSE